MLMMHRNVRHTPFGFYLANVAVADTGYIVFGIIPIVVQSWNGFNILTYTETGCKIVTFIQFVCGDYAIWLLLAVSVDRYLVVKYPFKALTMCTMKRARWISISLFTLSCFFNNYVLVTRGLVVMYQPYMVICGYLPAYTFFSTFIRPWYVLTGLVIIPGISLCTFNVIIIASMWKQSCARNDISSVSIGAGHTTITLLSINIMFLVLVCPCFVILICIPYLNLSAISIHYVVIGCVMLIHVNHSVNIFLYGFTSSQFRGILKSWLCGCIRTKSPPSAGNIVAERMNNQITTCPI